MKNYHVIFWGSYCLIVMMMAIYWSVDKSDREAWHKAYELKRQQTDDLEASLDSTMKLLNFQYAEMSKKLAEACKPIDIPQPLNVILSREQRWEPHNMKPVPKPIHVPEEKKNGDVKRD